MSGLERQKDFRAAQALPFCYVCDKDFADGEMAHSDHVPPRAFFADADRNFPLRKRFQEWMAIFGKIAKDVGLNPQ
jgi:hypothetical protein